MSEKLSTHEIHENLPSGQHERITARAKHEKHHVKHNAREEAQHAREAIRHEAESAAAPLERLHASEKATQPTPPNLGINRELKAITLRRELQHIRRKLPVPQRTLSKVIHQPVVRVTSEAAGKTISRPSGLLGGGFVALIGTSGYLYLANHIGFTYNYGVFLVLFAGGFALGLIIELIVHSVFKARRRANN